MRICSCRPGLIGLRRLERKSKESVFPIPRIGKSCLTYRAKKSKGGIMKSSPLLYPVLYPEHRRGQGHERHCEAMESPAAPHPTPDKPNKNKKPRDNGALKENKK